MMDGRALQNGEFDALEVLIKRWEVLRQTPVVDDDYPEQRHYYESAMWTFIDALEANGRLRREKVGVVQEAAIELSQAQAKFPPFNSGHEGYAVILEELDELWTEIRSNQTTLGRNDRMRKEAIQVAAMALRFLVDMPNFKN